MNGPESSPWPVRWSCPSPVEDQRAVAGSHAAATHDPAVGQGGAPRTE